MPLHLEIPDNRVGSLRQYYEKVFEEFKIKAQPLVDEWGEISPLLNQLGIISADLVGVNYVTKKSNQNKYQVKTDSTNLNGYDKKWGWLKKAEYVIRNKGVALTPKEIINQLKNVQEPDINEIKARNSLPATLSTAAALKKINRKTNERGEYVYDINK